MKNFLLKFVFATFVFVSFAGMPAVLAAQTTAQQDECTRLQQQINQYGGGQAAQLPQFCNTNTIYSKITSAMYYIIGIIAVISLIYAGYLYMMSRDNEAQTKKAKTVMLWTIVGVALALLATLIVGVVINLVVDNKVF